MSALLEANNTLYNDLQNLVPIEQIQHDKEELIQHKDVLNDMKTFENVDELKLHGLSAEEIEAINSINTHVQKGRRLISKTLKDYDACVDEIQKIDTNIRITKATIAAIQQQLECLSRVHEELTDISTPFLNSLLEKQEAIVSELQTNVCLLICKKDKLEVTIRALGTSYNILKNAPIHHTCPICITNEVDTYLEPCGHTLCRTCNRGTYCHMCRTKVRTAKSLYYS